MESSHLALKNLFTRFAKLGNASSDGSILSLGQVEKWFMSANIIGDTLTPNDVTKKIQTQLKPPGVPFKDFLLFLEDLATTLNTSFDELTTRLSSVPDPTTVSSADVNNPVSNVDSAGNIRRTFHPTENIRPMGIVREVVRDPPHIDDDVPFRATYADLPPRQSSPTSVFARNPTTASRVTKAVKDPLSSPTPKIQNIPEQASALSAPSAGLSPLPSTPAKKTGRFKKKT